MEPSSKLTYLKEFLNNNDTEGAIRHLSRNPMIVKSIERTSSGLESALGHAVMAGDVRVANKLLSEGAQMNLPLNFELGSKSSPMALVMTTKYQCENKNAAEMQDLLVKHFTLRKDNGQDGILNKIAEATSRSFDELKIKFNDLKDNPSTKGAPVIGALIGAGVIVLATSISFSTIAVAAAAVAVGSKVGAMMADDKFYENVILNRKKEQDDLASGLRYDQAYAPNPIIKSASADWVEKNEVKSEYKM